MKNKSIRLVALLLCVAIVFAFAGCSAKQEEQYQMKPLVGTAWDYSNMDNWMFFDDNDDVDHDVDVFFLYPTSVSSEVTTEVANKIEDMEKSAHSSYLQAADTFSSFTNMYAPYYRQVSGVGIMKDPTADGLMNTVFNNVTRTDVYAALDYYFQNCNKGKPYILAGHSQGSCNLKIVLSDYMKAHPDYLKNMVACYAIGYYFPDSWFQENPQVKKATGENDTGVLITWNTEGPDATKSNLPLGNFDGFVINPLNWKTDETPADVSQNKGSVFVDSDFVNDVYNFLKSDTASLVASYIEANASNVDTSEVRERAAKLIKMVTIKRTEGVADATINKARGALITTTYTEYIPDNPLFGDKSCHFEDWSLFTMNIRENAKVRIKAFTGKDAK